MAEWLTDWMKRQIIIRHMRWLIMAWRVEKHYDEWRKLGFFDVHRHHDDAALDRIWRGEQ
ncbi:hypothetical protein [Bradyrhizobium sp. S3.7.6]